MMATGLSSILLTAAGSLAVHTARSYAAIGNYAQLDEDSRRALDLLTRVARESDGVLEYTSHRLVLSYAAADVTFDYSPESKTLTYTDTNNVDQVLLEGCDYLNFEIFQRNCIGGSYEQHAATLTNSEAKLIRVAWVCSRTLIDQLLNTESVQSAKIVLRNQ